MYLPDWKEEHAHASQMKKTESSHVLVAGARINLSETRCAARPGLRAF